MNYKIAGKGSLFDLFGDFVVFRSMVPVDERVPPVTEALESLGLPPGRPPRKREPGYGKAAVWLIEKMHEVQNPGAPIQELLFVGDTSGDLRAFREIRDAGGWKGAIFLGKDGTGALRRDEPDVWRGDWAEVAPWIEEILRQGFVLGSATVAVVDIDKTAIGARGRNHKAIDKARMDAMRIVITETLGNDFDSEAFVRSYREVNRSEYHLITADNQDYIAYTCLVLSSGIVSLEQLRQAVEEGHLKSFGDFFEMVSRSIGAEASEGFRKVHESVANSLEAGDPTPFKAFRREELRQTIARMDALPDNTPVEELLDDEICITGEVWEAGIRLKERNVLLTSFSDKPDEASVAPDGMAVHRAIAKIVSSG